MKILLSLSLIFSCCHVFCQTQEEKEFNLSCQMADFDSLSTNRHVVHFKLLSRNKSNVVYRKPHYEGDLILVEDEYKTNYQVATEVVATIARIKQIGHIRVFTDCAAQYIFYQAILPTPEQEKHFKKSYLGTFDFEY